MGPSRRTNLSWLSVGLFVLAVLGALTFYRPFNSQAGNFEPDRSAPAPPRPLPKLPGKRVTFLVMGVDRRPDDVGRSDSMIVVQYDPASQQLALLSLPRDTWVEIPGHGYDKVNHSYAFGGEHLAVSTVGRLLGMPVDHYVTLSFNGFAKIVDALGGVEIDAEKRMLYNDPFDLSMGPDGLVIDIQQGLQHMDGMQALKYARYRKDDEGDIGRMRRQQQVIKALMTKAAEPAIIGRLPQLIPALFDAITTDMSVAEMLKLAAGAQGAISNPLKVGTLGGNPQAIGGIFYLVPNLVSERTTAYETLVGNQPPDTFLRQAQEDQETYVHALAEVLRGEKNAGTGQTQTGEKQPGPSQPGPGKLQQVTIAVTNASGKRTVGDAYVGKLIAAGFRVVYRRSPNTTPRTVVLDHAGQPGAVGRVQSVLPAALVKAALDPKAEVAMDIILGADLASQAIH